MSPPAWGQGTRSGRPTRTGKVPVLLRPPVPLLSSPETPSHRPRNCLTWAPVASQVDAQSHPSPSCVSAKLSWVPAGSPPRIHHHVVIPASSPCSTVTSHASSRAGPAVDLTVHLQGGRRPVSEPCSCPPRETSGN